MIREVEGDILLTRAAALAHGVAPGDDFKSGLALSLRTQWPAMYSDFRHVCHTDHIGAGDVWSWGGPGGTRIIALLTQEPSEGHGHPGRAKLKHVNHALKKLRAVIETEGYASVALPRLATGVGGLDWHDVRPLVERHLGDLDIPIYVYATYHPGQAAAEG